MDEHLTILLLGQLLAHVVSDFYLQGPEMAGRKDERGFGTGVLYLHGLFTFACSWAISGSWNFAWVSLCIAILHLIQDGLKPWICRHEWIRKRIFFLDQGLHLLVIAGACLLYNRLSPDAPAPVYSGWAAEAATISYVLAYALAMKPANLVIREILESNNIRLPDSDPGLAHAGRLIGSTERILAVTLILHQQYGALGFIIAAKSILRFREADAAKQEYVLTGSLLSFSIAVFLAIGATWMASA